MIRQIDYQITKNYNSINTFLREQEYPKAAFVYLRNSEDTVLVNGTANKLYQPLNIGDRLQIIIAENENSDIVCTAPDYDLEDIIIYEDEDILAINKPAGLPIHPSINHYSDTLANYVMDYYSKQDIDFVFRCVNRLDKNTSGVTIIAKNIISSALLSRQVKDKILKRTYLAICEGEVNESGVINAPIGRVGDSIITRQVDIENGQRAVTHYKRLDKRDIVMSNQEHNYSLVQLQLETGRTHQIRVHMKHIGHPLIGDDLYNPNYYLIKRQALHSACVEFIHPITHAPMNIEAPVPMDMYKLFSEK